MKFPRFRQWGPEIEAELQASKVGIVCVTPESQPRQADGGVGPSSGLGHVYAPKMVAKGWGVPLAGVVFLIGAGCSKDGERWEGWVYPDRTDLADYVRLGEFKSLQDCRSAARTKLHMLRATDDGDYECGLNCDDGSKYGGVKVCKETLR